MALRSCRFILFLILLSEAILSQTAGDDFIKDSLAIAKIKLIRPQLKFDNRINFYGKKGLPITGFDIGVLLANKLRLTVGYYKMSNSLKEDQYVRNDTAFGTLVRMEYGSINTELIYKDLRFFSLGMPLEIGAGINAFQKKGFFI